jgi:hypothetical protein
MVRWIAETVCRGRPERIEQVLSLADTSRTARDRDARSLLGYGGGNARQAKPLPPIEIAGRSSSRVSAIERRQDAGARPGACRHHLAGAPAARRVGRCRAAIGGRPAARMRGRTCTTAAGCHPADGGGIPNAASACGQRLGGRPGERVIHVVLHGLYGPVRVNGVVWNLHMPGLSAALDDDQVTGVLHPAGLGQFGREPSAGGGRAVRAASATRRSPGRPGLAGSPDVAAAGAGGVIRPGADGGLLLPARLAITTDSGSRIVQASTSGAVAAWCASPMAGRGRRRQPLSSGGDAGCDDASAGDRFVVKPSAADQWPSPLVGQLPDVYQYAIGTIDLAAGVNRS